MSMNAERLLTAVKQAVKLLVEEAVTRRFIHQDSTNITALCVELDKAITFGLLSKYRRWRSAPSSADVLRYLGELYKPAEDLTKKCQEIIAIVGQHNSGGGFFSSRRSIRLQHGGSSFSGNDHSGSGGGSGVGWRQRLFSTYSAALSHRGHEGFLWIRIALMEKTLAQLVEELVRQSSVFYESGSLMSDPVRGPIVATLLAGPCALDYSRMKTPDHRNAEPIASDLVVRERMNSKTEGSSSTVPHHSMEKNSAIRSDSPAAQRKETEGEDKALQCIAALHQNTHATLIYGKNNALVEMTPGRNIPGYLSVHQAGSNMLLKWTPNELVTGKPVNQRPTASEASTSSSNQSAAHAMAINLSKVVCIHCHPYAATESSREKKEGDEEIDVQRLQFVLQDGTSLPPIGLQHGSTLFNFLAMLETALLPNVRLDPSLWGQHEDRASSFPPPWPVTKKPSLSLFTGVPSPQQQADDRSKKSAPAASSMNRKIDLPDLTNSLAGARQFNARQRLERGCIFRLIPTGMEDTPHRSPSPVEILLGLRKENGDVTTSATRDDDSAVAPSPEPDERPARATEQPPISIERTTSGGQRSVGDMNRLATERMQERIMSRTFYGWMMYCRDMRIVRNNLSKLLLPVCDSGRTAIVNKAALDQWGGGLTSRLWEQLMTNNGVIGNPSGVMKYVFFGGIQDDTSHTLRKQVWPYLLRLYSVDSTPTQRTLALDELKEHYNDTLSSWVMVENSLKELHAEELIVCEQMFADLPSRNEQLNAMWKFHEDAKKQKLQKRKNTTDGRNLSGKPPSFSYDDSASDTSPTLTPTPSQKRTTVNGDPAEAAGEAAPMSPGNMAVLDLKNELTDSCTCKVPSGGGDELNPAASGEDEGAEMDGEGKGSRTDSAAGGDTVITYRHCPMCGKPQQREKQQLQQRLQLQRLAAPAVNAPTSLVNGRMDSSGDDQADAGGGDGSSITDGFSGQRRTSTTELDPLDQWGRELHKIDKDVVRCDRTYPYFVPANLEKMRRVIATYVWERQPPGYIQGMMDLLAPLMVVFDDEVMAYGCFCKLMEIMEDNFPHGKAMDNNFLHMRLLFEVYDRELFDLMTTNGDYTHFFFAYRWYLLDLKRELEYVDIFKCWECIWAARHCCTDHFTLFLCTAMVHVYRDVILKNNMDFTEIIKFFNDLAEKHNLEEILNAARDIVEHLQKLLLNECKESCDTVAPLIAPTTDQRHQQQQQQEQSSN